MSCWNSNGRPTAALDAFLIDPSLGIKKVYSKPLAPVYPNPNSDGLLRINLKDFNDKSVVRLMEMNGKIVIEQTFFNQSKALLDVSILHGMYILNITNSNQNSSEKIVIN